MPDRDRYVIGQLGSYECVTQDAVDNHLGKLATQVATTTAPPAWRRVWNDIDKLLDRRHHHGCTLCNHTNSPRGRS